MFWTIVLLVLLGALLWLVHGVLFMLQKSNRFLIDPWLGERVYRIRQLPTSELMVAEYSYWWWPNWRKVRAPYEHVSGLSEDHQFRSDTSWRNGAYDGSEDREKLVEIINNDVEVYKQRLELFRNSSKAETVKVTK